MKKKKKSGLKSSRTKTKRTARTHKHVTGTSGASKKKVLSETTEHSVSSGESSFILDAHGELVGPVESSSESWGTTDSHVEFTPIEPPKSDSEKK